METVVLLLVFIIIGIMGYIVMNKLGASLEEIQRCRDSERAGGMDIIRIACENPTMLSAVSCAVDKMLGEFRKISFCFYTGCRDDIQKMLENGNADIVLLTEEGDIGIGKSGEYGKKVSSFVPISLMEPLTGLRIEPVEKQQMAMYVIWQERHMTEEQRRLLSNI